MPYTPVQLFLFSVMALVPSAIWLFYYLRKDDHAEPKHILIQLFLVGFLLPPFVGLLEKAGQDWVVFFGASPLAVGFLIGAALLEEAVKYMAALLIFYHNKEFDEPVDAMVYLIVVALGFAASENIIITLSTATQEPTQSIVLLLSLRFLGATLLHTLASGIVGYSIARWYFFREHFSLARGLASATCVHAFFNIFILKSFAPTASPAFIFLVIALLVGGLFVTLGDFRLLKRFGHSRLTLT